MNEREGAVAVDPRGRRGWRAARGASRGLALALAVAAAAAGEGQGRQLTRLVDSPTAGLVGKGRFAVDLRLFPHGGLLTQVEAGVLRRLTIGISYGGAGIIGDDGIDWYPRVEASARYRLFEESQRWPAVLVGFETQGYGAHAAGRYQIKSKGAYVAVSRNYTSALGQVGFHGGVNLSREDGDDGDPSGWLGIDKTLNDELSLAAEYDFALNDNGDDALGSGRGYLNLGAYWSAVPELTIGLVFKNVLRNGDADRGVPGGPDGDLSRELSVRYTERF